MTEAAYKVIAAVLRRNGRYLLCKRPEGKNHSGKWEFPGGKLEPGESISQAARRELAEELSLNVSACGASLFSSVDASSGLIIEFLEVEATGEPILHEHADFKWVTASELLSMDLAPSDLKFAYHLRDFRSRT